MSPSAYIRPYTTPKGERRWRVEYRQGGRATKKVHAGSFRTERDAKLRRNAILSELASGHDPRLTILAVSEDQEVVTVQLAAKRWQASRHDITPQTARRHDAQLSHALERFGQRVPESISPAEVSEWVGEMASTFSAEYTRKIANALAMVLGHHGVQPNPVRDERVRLPRVVRPDVDAPETRVLEQSLSLMPARYRLAVIVLESTAMRVSELENLTWADLDAPRSRWRVSKQREKSRRGRWVPVPPDVMAAVEALVPREDRVLDDPVMPWFRQGNLRQTIARAVKAAGLPRWSPHGLRRRRISLWHREGISWAQIGEWAGQRDLATTANAYTRVMVGEELNRVRVDSWWGIGAAPQADDCRDNAWLTVPFDSYAAPLAPHARGNLLQTGLRWVRAMQECCRGGAPGGALVLMPRVEAI